MAMIFKPEIDFTKLLETGRMSHQDLTQFFGKMPTDGELEWARREAKARHPAVASLIRSSRASGLYLMDQPKAADYNGRRIMQQVGGLRTAIETHEKTPTNKLDSEQLKRHDTIVRCAKTITTELTKAVKALPWEASK
jgi:hypothetical protein